MSVSGMILGYLRERAQGLVPPLQVTMVSKGSHFPPIPPLLAARKRLVGREIVLLFPNLSARRRRVAELRGLGHSVTAIGKALGLGEKSIRNDLKHPPAPLPPAVAQGLEAPPPHEAPVPVRRSKVKVVAKQAAERRARIERLRIRHRETAEMRALGRSYGKIARALGVTESAVYDDLKRSDVQDMLQKIIAFNTERSQSQHAELFGNPVPEAKVESRPKLELLTRPTSSRVLSVMTGMTGAKGVRFYVPESETESEHRGHFRVAPRAPATEHGYGVRVRPAFRP